MTIHVPLLPTNTSKKISVKVFEKIAAAEKRRPQGFLRSRIPGFLQSFVFRGTALISDALCEAGDAAGAYQLLMQTECPSWLYQVTMGATTIWERWDSIQPDGRINPGSMTSFNHYAFGAVADWLHRVVGGLEPTFCFWRADFGNRGRGFWSIPTASRR